MADDTRPKGFDLLRGSSDVPDPIISGGPADDTEPKCWRSECRAGCYYPDVCSENRADDTVRLTEQEALPWGDVPYDHMTPAEVVHDYAIVRGDLPEQYARDQLARWIERYTTARLSAVEAERAGLQERLAEVARLKETYHEEWMVNAREVERLTRMLNKLGFCPKDGDPMPCMTCGAGL